MKRRVTIIGANSFIARNLIVSIDKADNELFLYDRDTCHLDNKDDYFKVDLLNIQDVENINFDCDIIFLFTGKTGTSRGFDDYDSFIDINERILLNILTVYRNKKSKSKIIFPSTRLVYKGSDSLLNEDSEKEFKTIYAINKYSCENYLKLYNHTFNIQFCILRICVPYGSIIKGASSYGTLDFFVRTAKEGKIINIYGDGCQKRTFTHIDDLCNIMWLTAINDKCKNDAYNIGGQALSIYEVASKTAQLYSVNVNSTEWPELDLKIESGNTVFDSSKLDKILQYEYKHNFNDWLKYETEVI